MTPHVRVKEVGSLTVELVNHGYLGTTIKQNDWGSPISSVMAVMGGRVDEGLGIGVYEESESRKSGIYIAFKTYPLRRTSTSPRLRLDRRTAPTLHSAVTTESQTIPLALVAHGARSGWGARPMA